MTSSETFEFVRISFARINISLSPYSKRETRKINFWKISSKVILSNFGYFSLRRRSFWSSSDASTSNWVVTRREKDKWFNSKLAIIVILLIRLNKPCSDITIWQCYREISGSFSGPHSYGWVWPKWFRYFMRRELYLFKADGFSLNLLIHIQNRNRDRNQIFSDLTRSDFLNAFEGWPPKSQVGWSTKMPQEEAVSSISKLLFHGRKMPWML